MQHNWRANADQLSIAASRAPFDICNCQSAANMGAIELPFGLQIPDFNQNQLLIGAGILAAAVLGYQMFAGKSAKRRRVASAKAKFAQQYAEETGRFPRF